MVIASKTAIIRVIEPIAVMAPIGVMVPESENKSKNETISCIIAPRSG